MTLGIDTSGNTCSVALLSEGLLLSEFSVNNKKTHSAMLLPMIDDLLCKAGFDISDLDLVAVSKGPGSFTGLRIGAATAKGIAQATNLPLVGVSALEALAYNLRDFGSLVCPIMDARRGEVYTAAYLFTDGEPKTLIPPEAMALSDLLNRLRALEYEVIFLGDGVLAHWDYIRENADFNFSKASPNLLLQRASSVAFLGEKMAKEAGDSKSLTLEYLRKPQAEREREGS